MLSLQRKTCRYVSDSFRNLPAGVSDKQLSTGLGNWYWVQTQSDNVGTFIQGDIGDLVTVVEHRGDVDEVGRGVQLDFIYVGFSGVEGDHHVAFVLVRVGSKGGFGEVQVNNVGNGLDGGW